MARGQAFLLQGGGDCAETFAGGTACAPTPAGALADLRRVHDWNRDFAFLVAETLRAR